MLGEEVRNGLRLVNGSVVNDHRDFSLQMTEQVGEEGDESRGFDGAFMGLLKELAVRRDATDDGELFPGGLGEDDRGLTACRPGVADDGLHADSDFIGPDDDFTVIYLFFPTLEALLPATHPTAQLCVPLGASPLSAMKSPISEAVSPANQGHTRRHTSPQCAHGFALSSSAHRDNARDPAQLEWCR